MFKTCQTEESPMPSKNLDEDFSSFTFQK